ncbi:MAG: hypothetical protein WCO09_00815 [bacterium]
MNDEPQVRSIAWEAYEHEHREKSKDWYWSLGIIIATASFLSIIFGSYLFGILLIVIGASLGVVGSRHPRLVLFELNKMGVRIGNKLFPYATLEAFWVQDNNEHGTQSQLLIKSRRTMVPLIIIPLEGVETEDVRDFLLYNLLEKEIEESFSQLILESLGF